MEFSMPKKPKIIFGRIFWRDATLTTDVDDNDPDECFVKEDYGCIYLKDENTIRVEMEYDYIPTPNGKVRRLNTKLDIPRDWGRHIEQCVGPNKWKKVNL